MNDQAQTMPPRIGRYDILQRLAIGGMAEVFLACERGPHGLQRLVVVKRILPHLAHHEAMVNMFLQEARVAARINHPNVVQILELAEHGGQPYIVMEYVAGSTLRELYATARAKERPIPVGVAISLVTQACAGAHAAHELRDPQGKPYGLVHRDLSPHNLMLDGRGHIKVLDFGIAKATEGLDETRTGMLKGKLRYMSPEQCRQEPLDRRSDVFTLGIVLWEVLAGQRLYERPTELATMQAVIAGEREDLRAHRPEVPAALAQAVDQALEVHRDARHPTADAMRRALLSAATDAGLLVNQDVVATFVEEMLGAHHAARAAAVEDALEKTSVSLSLRAGSATSGHTASSFRTLDVPAPGQSRTPLLGLLGLALGVLGLGAATLAAALAFFLLAPGGGETAQPAPPPPEGPPVTLALAPVLDPGLLSEEMEPLRRYVEQALDRPLHLQAAESYAETGRMVAQGEVPFAILPPFIFVQTREEHPDLRLLAIKVFDGSSGTDGVLLVPENSRVRDISDLRGARICYSDRDSTSGFLLPRMWLRDQGIDPDGDMIGRVSGNHFQVLRDLQDGACDVGGTYSGAYLAADHAGVAVARMRVLAITGRTPHDAVVAGPAADPELADRLEAILHGFDPVEALGVERVGEIERITGFTLGDATRYDALERAWQREKGANP